MTTLISATDVRSQLETDLDDTALGAIIASADSEIIRRYGPHSGGAVTEEFTFDNPVDILWLSRVATVVTAGVERYPAPYGETVVTLATNDFILGDSGRSVRRLGTGSHGSLLVNCWAPIVTLTFTTVNQDDQRKSAMMDIVKTTLAFRADDKYLAKDFRRDVEMLYRSLAPGPLGFWA